MPVAMALAPMTARGFLKNLTDSVVSDVKNHVLGVDRLRVVVKPGDGGALEPVAFFASNVRRVSVQRQNDHVLYHAGGGIVADSYQGKGLGRLVMIDELAETSATLFGCHTQSMHALKMSEKLAEYDFSLSRELATEMGTPDPVIQMLGHRPSVIHVGRYGGQGLYGNLNEFERKKMVIQDLDYQKGDAVVIVGKVINI